MLRFGLGSAYYQAQDYLKAITHLSVAIQHDPNYSAAWKLLGRAFESDKQFERAIATFAHGIDIAEKQGDKQAVREMQVFLKRLQKVTG